MKTTNLEYTNIPVLLPAIDYFIDKLKNEELFHFYKVNHGMLDGLYFAYRNDYDTLYNDLSNKNYNFVANRVLNNFKDKDWGLNYWHGDSNQILNYIEIFVKVLNETSNITKKLHTGLSLGVGLNTFWGVWDKEHHIQIGRAEIAKKIISANKNEFYYSGIFKHYTIKKEIYKLFNTLNDLDFEIIFFGPDYLRLYKDVFSIKNFNHIVIPVRGAAESFENHMSILKHQIKKSNKKTIVFHSAGQMLSANIVYELKDLYVWGVDVGRSFDILIKNHVDVEPTMYKCWTFLDEFHLNQYVDNLRNNSYG